MRQVRFLELHSDLFHAGKNFGKKLVPKTLQGLSLYWDAKQEWFEITWNKRTGYIFASNCAFVEFEEGDVVELPKNEHQTHRAVQAQISTPHGHVFEGLGHGETGVAQPITRKPGRPAKVAE